MKHTKREVHLQRSWTSDLASKSWRMKEMTLAVYGLKHIREPLTHFRSEPLGFDYRNKDQETGSFALQQQWKRLFICYLTWHDSIFRYKSSIKRKCTRILAIKTGSFICLLWSKLSLLLPGDPDAVLSAWARLRHLWASISMVTQHVCLTSVPKWGQQMPTRPNVKAQGFDSNVHSILRNSIFNWFNSDWT